MDKTSDQPDLSRAVILVTGGAGFIGSALSHLLAPAVRRFVAVDNLHPQVHATATRPAALHERAELVVGDVTEERTWERLLQEVTPTIVIHLAAETGTGQSLSEATRHANVNVVGTTRMLDAFTGHSITPEHLVLSGSRAVYGEGAWSDPAGTVTYPGQRSHRQLAAAQWDHPGLTSLPSRAADTRPEPTSVYGATKLAQEHILSAWCQATAVPLTVLRLQNVYGPGQSLTNSYTGIVTLFSQLARAGKTIPLYEDGQVTRDFVYIDDVARAFVAALRARPASSLTLDVGSGRASTIAAMASAVAAYHGAPAPEVNGAFRDGDVRHASCVIADTLEALEWKPDWDLESGLAALQRWIELNDSA